MARTRFAGRRGKYRRHKRKGKGTRRRHSRRSRRGLLGNVARLGADSTDDVFRGTGAIVGKVPVVGRYGRGALDLAGRTGSDLFDLAGTTGDRAAGLLTSPFKRLFGRSRRKRRRGSRRHRRKRTRRRRRR